jgi:squalene-hopene/tetraprenyl-beta-curcumene cyclase
MISFAASFVVLCLVTMHLRADEPVTLENVQPPDENKKDEPLAAKFSLTKASQFLDSAAVNWTQKQGCFSCHTNYAYLYARPHLSSDVPAHAEVRHALEEMVTKRWADKGPRWDAEVVASAAALAYNDAATTGKLHPVTRTALDRIWKVQRKDGGFSWINCGWPPMENDDHYGVTLAAIATGVAPDGYAKTDAGRKGLDGIRTYLKANPPQNLHHRTMMLWASTYVEGICTDDAKQATVKDLLALQLPDGGWSAAGLGTWKRGDKLEQDPKTSDGYGTGFVLFVLHRAGVPSKDEAVQRGIAWLKANQRESGRWFTRSLNRDNKHYLTHVGSAFAVMALSQADDHAVKR